MMMADDHHGESPSESAGGSGDWVAHLPGIAELDGRVDAVHFLHTLSQVFGFMLEEQQHRRPTTPESIAEHRDTLENMLTWAQARPDIEPHIATEAKYFDSLHQLAYLALPVALMELAGDMLQYLLFCGCNPNDKNSHGCTPLHYLAKSITRPLGADYQERVFWSLHDSGANLEARDNHGQTPLHTAAMRSNQLALYFYHSAVRQGRVNPLLLDDAGRTPYQLCHFDYWGMTCKKLVRCMEAAWKIVQCERLRLLAEGQPRLPQAVLEITVSLL